MPGEFRPSLPGERRGGRAKGTPNKADATIKDMVIRALHGAGGVDYLIEQARANPTAFMTLVGRVLPLQLAGHDGGKLEVEFRWKDADAHTTINGVATTVDTDNAVDTDVDTPSITFIGEC